MAGKAARSKCAGLYRNSHRKTASCQSGVQMPIIPFHPGPIFSCTAPNDSKQKEKQKAIICDVKGIARFVTKVPRVKKSQGWIASLSQIWYKYSRSYTKTSQEQKQSMRGNNSIASSTTTKMITIHQPTQIPKMSLGIGFLLLLSIEAFTIPSKIFVGCHHHQQKQVVVSSSTTARRWQTMTPSATSTTQLQYSTNGGGQREISFYYDVLGVSKNKSGLSEKIIKAAYRKLAKLYHPGMYICVWMCPPVRNILFLLCSLVLCLSYVPP